MASESDFERDFLEELEILFPGCFIMKNDSSLIQGIPDRIVLFENKWAMLEFKKAKTAKHKANQDVYIRMFGDMSYASFVNPQNRERVINELQATFRSSRPARIFKSKHAQLD